MQDVHRPKIHSVIVLVTAILAIGSGLLFAQPTPRVPTLNLPDAKIVEVYRGNWHNTLKPCRENTTPPGAGSPHTEPHRPWKVDVNGHYPGWYPGVDVKHSAAAYLACGRDLPLVLRAWNLTTSRYQMDDGGVRPSTMDDNPQGIWPETTVDGSVVFYPLRTVATIDYLLLGDVVFRFSQDKPWLTKALPTMRRAAAFLEGWIDDEGLLHSDSYDLDQVYREIDGVAQASAYLAFRRLAALEAAIENEPGRQRAEATAARLAQAANKHFWNLGRGYYDEHLIYNNVARTGRLGSVSAVSSELDAAHSAKNAIDGALGVGVDAFGVGVGAAGKHEWAAKNETVGAWIQIGFQQPTRIAKAILVNRTDPRVQPGERFARGFLEFSDGSPKVEVSFNALGVSRAVVAFSPRRVTWIKFIGTSMQGKGGAHAGLAEFAVLPAEQPYRKVSHGMTDTNFAMVAFGVADDARAASIWRYFRKNELRFYEVNGLHAPTWISEATVSYGDGELNRRAPYKDCVAMARIWRYDALMRRRMRDGEGLYRTIQYANALYDRPSGGGVGWFAERYGLGRFQPGDEAQATIPKYAGYPAVYNSTIVQEALLGLSVDASGAVRIDPCVPSGWYTQGFGQEGCGVLKNHDLGFTCRAKRLEGWIRGPVGSRTLHVQRPPQLTPVACEVVVDGKSVPHESAGNLVTFTVRLPEDGRVKFAIRGSVESTSARDRRPQPNRRAPVPAILRSSRQTSRTRS